MNEFDVHTKQSAPPESASLLATAEKAYGFIPNVLGVMAESPAILNAYLTIGQIFEKSSFSSTEREVVVLATNRFNDCGYCMAAHSAISIMRNIPDDVIGAIRDDRPIEDEKLEALRVFTTLVLDKQGWLSAADVAGFLAAGYTRAQALEIILGISFKTLSNYVNHIAGTPLDDAFAAHAWAPVDVDTSLRSRSHTRLK